MKKRYVYAVTTSEGTLLTFADDGNEMLKHLLVVERCEENFKIADIELIERTELPTEEENAAQDGEVELVAKLIERIGEEARRLHKQFPTTLKIV